MSKKSRPFGKKRRTKEEKAEKIFSGRKFRILNKVELKLLAEGKIKHTGYPFRELGPILARELSVPFPAHNDVWPLVFQFAARSQLLRVPWDKKPKEQKVNKTRGWNEFYSSKAWRELRYEAFKRYGRHCCVCGRGREHGVVLHVDHKIPRSKRPDLALDISNVQIMCEDDNIGKGNRDSIDWQAPEPDNNPELTAAFKATMH